MLLSMEIDVEEYIRELKQRGYVTYVPYRQEIESKLHDVLIEHINDLLVQTVPEVVSALEEEIDVPKVVSEIKKRRTPRIKPPET